MLYAYAVWLAAGFVARRDGRARSALVEIGSVLALVACFVAVYPTPYHAARPQVTLLEVYR
ncbi:MAG: hypothetical protein MUF70_17430 [Myxococcota bacterium]|nr:hypothetical protein [Myxococcota bacterium]